MGIPACTVAIFVLNQRFKWGRQPAYQAFRSSGHAHNAGNRPPGMYSTAQEYPDRLTHTAGMPKTCQGRRVYPRPCLVGALLRERTLRVAVAGSWWLGAGKKPRLPATRPQLPATVLPTGSIIRRSGAFAAMDEAAGRAENHEPVRIREPGFPRPSFLATRPCSGALLRERTLRGVCQFFPQRYGVSG